MNALRRTAPGLALGCLLTVAGPASAELVWSWDMLDSTPTVSPTQTITLNAVLSNAPVSTEHITWASLQEFFVNGNGDGTYTFAAPSIALAQQFAGLDLAPGESFEFEFGRYLPSAPPVAEGQYWGDGFAISMRDAAGVLSSWSPDHDYVITVVDPDDRPLPEPTTWGLLAAGLAALGAVRRKQR